MTTRSFGQAYGRNSLGHSSQPTRHVFFSFHYQDIWRVNEVRKDVVRHNHGNPRGYFDGSLSEKAKTEGTASVKRLINRGLSGCSVTCVLIGKNTFQRHWVHYEIFKSIEHGKGVFGVFIGKLKNYNKRIDARGANPFRSLAYSADTRSKKLTPYVRRPSGWEIYTETGPISASVAPCLSCNSINLRDLFRVYDWVDSDGYSNFTDWVQVAALQAQR